MTPTGQSLAAWRAASSWSEATVEGTASATPSSLRWNSSGNSSAQRPQLMQPSVTVTCIGTHSFPGAKMRWVLVWRRGAQIIPRFPVPGGRGSHHSPRRCRRRSRHAGDPPRRRPLGKNILRHGTAADVAVANEK